MDLLYLIKYAHPQITHSHYQLQLAHNATKFLFVQY